MKNVALSSVRVVALIAVAISMSACKKQPKGSSGDSRYSRTQPQQSAVPGHGQKDAGTTDLDKSKGQNQADQRPSGAVSIAGGDLLNPNYETRPAPGLESSGAATLATETDLSVPTPVVTSLVTTAQATTVAPVPATAARVAPVAQAAPASVTAAQQVPATPPVAVAAPSAPAATLVVPTREVGPGLPKTYSLSQVPLVTGALDERGQIYTDAKDDSVMAVMVDKMNQQEATFHAESLQLAQSVAKVEFEINGQYVSLNLKLKFVDQEINTTMTGVLNGRTAELKQIQPVGNFELRAHSICVDANQECRNVVIVLGHVINGQLCKRAYINHRWMMGGVGDGHFTLSKEDYEAWNKPISRAQKAFLRMVANTVHYNKVLFREIGNEPLKYPRLGFLGVRSWAVAYGKSGFEITMKKLALNGGTSDETKFSGELTKSWVSGDVTQELNVSGNYNDAEVNDRFDERFAPSISQVLLVNNDGRGNLTLQIDFTGEVSEGGQTVTKTTGSSRMNFTGLRIQTQSAQELQAIVP